MEPATALVMVENSLRDFIEYKLSKKYGNDWIDNCGVTESRITKWREKKDVDFKKMENSGIVESRLIYYSDFYDLLPMLKKHWSSDFALVFGKQSKMETYLEILETFRNCSAHGREYLPHQSHLILGIVGDIRTMIIRYRSKLETSEDYYARFESIRDSLGTVVGPGVSCYSSGKIMAIGETVDFVLTATDPLGGDLLFRMYVPRKLDGPWVTDNKFSIAFDEQTTGKTVPVCFYVKSTRPSHAKPGYDDFVELQYEVLPIRR